jgi:hypothetical protein
MTTPVGKTYIPTGTRKMKDLCNFVTKHGGTIVAATTLLSPTDAAAMAAAIASIQSACALFSKIELIFDPNYNDETAPLV